MNNEKYVVETTEKDYMQYMQYLENKGYRVFGTGDKPTKSEYKAGVPCVIAHQNHTIQRYTREFFENCGYKIISVREAMGKNLIISVDEAIQEQKCAVRTTPNDYMIYMKYLEDKGYKWYMGQKATEEEFDSINPCIWIVDGKILRQSHPYLHDRGYKIISVDEAMGKSAYGFYSMPTNKEFEDMYYDPTKKEFKDIPTFNPTPTPTMTLNDKINEMYFTDEVAQDAANVVKQLGEYEETLDQLLSSVRNHEIKVRDCKRLISDTFDRNDRVRFEKYLKLGKDLLKVLAKHDYIKAGAKLSKEDK